jgi:hypothetical protein
MPKAYHGPGHETWTYYALIEVLPAYADREVMRGDLVTFGHAARSNTVQTLLSDKVLMSPKKIHVQIV